MEMSVLFLSSLLVVVFATPDSIVPDEENRVEDPFIYDYETLRIGGLSLAVVLFTLGILLILSRRCRCGANKKTRTSGDEEAQEETMIVSKYELRPRPGEREGEQDSHLQSTASAAAKAEEN